MLLDTTSSVGTPERVCFRHRIAGPGKRALAWSIDAAIQGALLLLASIGGLVVGGWGWGAGASMLILFLMSWGYGSAFEIALQGRTPGKALLRLRVVTDTGAPARPLQLVLRNLLRGVDALPMLYGVGVFAAGADRALRRLGDQVAGTMVVDEKPERLQGVIRIHPPITEAERRALPAHVELTRDEIHAIEALLLRGEALGPSRREELAGLFAPVVRELGIEARSDLRAVTLAYARAVGLDREEGP